MCRRDELNCARVGCEGEIENRGIRCRGSRSDEVDVSGGRSDIVACVGGLDGEIAERVGIAGSTKLLARSIVTSSNEVDL